MVDYCYISNDINSEILSFPIELLSFKGKKVRKFKKIIRYTERFLIVLKKAIIT